MTAIPAPAQVPTRSQIDGAADVVLPTDPATVLAVVGKTPILLGEIKPRVDARINDVLAKTQQEVPADQLRFARLQMTRGLLSQAIQNRVMREAFLLDQVATQAADKRREADETMQAKARQMFFEEEMPSLMKKMSAESSTDLDSKLREKGSSLVFKQNEFIDAMLGHLYIRSKVNQDPPISLAEIHQYYQSHQADYDRPASATWEQLTVLVANYANRDLAYQAIWEMGREAFFGGNMQAIARDKSEEPFASSGGLHDWTTQGSLASDVLDQQIFTLPLNAMSQIIQDSDAYHIVRVLDRKDAGRLPMAEVQDDIRDILRDQKVQKSQREVMVEVQRLVPVWSLYPDDVPGCEELSLPSSIATSTPPTQR